MYLEQERAGKIKRTAVNKRYLESGEYRRKFDNATNVPEVNKTLYDCAKRALKHRSGTKLEDMYWIDGNTGRVLHSVTDSKDERGIKADDRLKGALKGHDVIVTIHTHPGSMPPSVADLNSLFQRGYTVGFIACHNGKVFGYTCNELLDDNLNNAHIEKYMNNGCSEFDAQKHVLENMMKSFDFRYWEVKV